MSAAFRTHAPDIAPLIDTVAENPDIAAAVRQCYTGLRSISVDFAVMEHAKRILVAESRFVWDDVGSWTAVEHHFPQDAEGNTVLGKVHLSAVSDSVAVNAGDSHRVVVAGLTDIIVVHTSDATLVCSKSQLVNMKALVGDK